MTTNQTKTKNIFGERLKNFRHDTLGKTQKEFAELLGLPQPTLSAYESGRIKPNIDALINISEKCNLSLDWLCGRSTPPTVNSLGDILNFMFEFYNAKEFEFKTELHDKIDLEDINDENKRNWIKLTFYRKNTDGNSDITYNSSICDILNKVYQLQRDYSSYYCTKEYYESEKQRLVKLYSDWGITQNEYPYDSEEDLVRKRLEHLQKEIDSINSPNK